MPYSHSSISNKSFVRFLLQPSTIIDSKSIKYKPYYFKYKALRNAKDVTRLSVTRIHPLEIEDDFDLPLKQMVPKARH